MRKIACLLVLITSFSLSVQSQLLKTTLPASQFSENLNKVVTDFKRNYYGIQGEALSPSGETDIFRSNVTLPGSVSSVILRFHSKLDTTASWQAIMFQGEAYDQALKAYRNTSRLLNRSRVNLSGSSPVGFSGKLNEPEANVTFASSSFKLDTEDPYYAKFYAEIEMINTGFDSWEVRLNLHNRKADTEEE
jgi:hypothetical protein